MSEEKRARGRPKGKKRLPLKKWNPGKWEPIYDLMVARSIQGFKNTQIALEFGYSPEHISNILTSELAIKAKAAIIQQGRDKIAETFDGRAKQVADLTMKRAHELLTDDDRFIKNPFSVIQVGLAVTRTMLPEKVIKPDEATSVTNITNNVTVFNNTQLKELNEGLKSLQEVKRLHLKAVNE